MWVDLFKVWVDTTTNQIITCNTNNPIAKIFLHACIISLKSTQIHSIECRQTPAPKPIIVNYIMFLMYDDGLQSSLVVGFYAGAFFFQTFKQQLWLLLHIF